MHPATPAGRVRILPGLRHSKSHTAILPFASSSATPAVLEWSSVTRNDFDTGDSPGESSGQARAYLFRTLLETKLSAGIPKLLTWVSVSSNIDSA